MSENNPSFICQNCGELHEHDKALREIRNQTLAEVLNIVEQITNRDGDINVFQLKEEIKKIQSQEQERKVGTATLSSAVISPDTNTQNKDFFDHNLIEKAVCKAWKPQNLKGCGKFRVWLKQIDGVILVVCNQNHLCEKCQGKVK